MADKRYTFRGKAVPLFRIGGTPVAEYSSLLIIALACYSFHFLFHGYGMVRYIFKFDLAEPLEKIWKAVWSRLSIGISHWYKSYVRNIGHIK